MPLSRITQDLSINEDESKNTRLLSFRVHVVKKTGKIVSDIIIWMNTTDEEYMRLAIEQARIAGQMGEIPIGAVVVYKPIDPATRRPLADPCVIAAACNRRETDNDPAGHAEFLAMKQASDILGAWRLTGCTVYVTLEPCVMCSGLMHQARIDRCVYAAADPKAGALGSLYSIHSDERLNHRFQVTSGICEEECASMLKKFFADKRAAAKAAKLKARGMVSCCDRER